MSSSRTDLLGKHVVSSVPSRPLKSEIARVVAINANGVAFLECACCGAGIGEYPIRGLSLAKERP